MRNVGFFGLHKLAIVGLTCAAAAIAGCAEKRGGSIPYNVGDFTAPDPISTAALDD